MTAGSREGRADPDRLLARARAEEAEKADGAARTGRLKCFFGAAPGVGKTYGMLEAARARALEGVDVVVGIVETHGREGTAAALAGLEVLPRASLSYRGRALEELDLDAALARRPGLLLVDELAHTNVPGARHKKRWQDVFELLDAGIDVYTTLNVQHVESLNDVVAQITGVVVQETVPDAVLDRATEVELVDLPPDELLKRLREGKVYRPEQAARALESFFRKGNLLALRELALRRTAERVDDQLRGFRLAYGIDATWSVRERVLVSVGPSPLSARLVRAASRMARSLRAEWYAVTVEPASRMSAADTKARLHAHLRLAESLGAKAITLSGDRVAEELVAFAKAHDVTKIIVGKPTHPRWRDVVFGSLVDDIVRTSGAIDVHVITGDGAEAAERGAAELGTATRSVGGPRPEIPWPVGEYAQAGLAIALATSVGWAMRGTFEQADIVMAYLLAVVVVSFRLGRGPSTFAALLGIAAYDFFFVPPTFTFSVDDLRHLITFGTMWVVALVVNGLAHRVRGQAEAARERERRTAALSAAGLELAATSGLAALGQVASAHFVEVFGGQVSLLFARTGGTLAPLPGASPGFFDDKERGVAQWAFEHDQAAGRGTDTLPSARALHVPLRASRGPLGVISLLSKHPDEPALAGDPDRRHLLEAFASQTALAFERALAVEEAQASAIVVERERLVNALLSSVSHDLRTPLASITGATSFLLDQADVASPEVRRDLLETVHEEAVRLNRLVANLLQMTRLSAGAIVVHREWQPLEEVVGVALERLEPMLVGRDVQVELPDDLPLLPIDALLIEQVLQNLLENAVRYTPAGSPLLLSAETELATAASANELDDLDLDRGERSARAVVVSLDDAGPGIEEASAQRIFERFYRGARDEIAHSRDTSSGLGLAICHGMVKAHGGRIWVERSTRLGGARFRFSLPIVGVAPGFADLSEVLSEGAPELPPEAASEAAPR